MGTRMGARYCRCGTRLASDNPDQLCGACRKQSKDTLVSAPTVPPEFWQTDRMQDAIDAWHMGRVIQAYRLHPWHGRPLAQEVVASWVGLTQTQLSRIENGAPPADLTKLIQWAHVLRVPPELLWFKLPAARAGERRSAPSGGASPVGSYIEGREDVNRREVLRLMSLASTLLTVPPAEPGLDFDRLAYGAGRPSRLDAGTLDQYERLNAHLWRVFAASKSKRLALPMVRKHLDVLTTGLQQTHGLATRQRLCRLTGDLFQLCGEIFFDSNQYTEAAQCYSLAAGASKDADAYDLWACAMTRHAFIGMHERRFDKAAPLLAGASHLARRGDSSLSTRHWVAAVQAQAFAGLGDLAACQRALDGAERVKDLKGPVHTSGWLRFEGSRLAEERGACYVELGRPELAEAALTEALARDVSPRRRGCVLADLALVGAQRGDSDQLVMYADAALDAAKQTASGYVGRRLQKLQPRLKPFMADSHVRHLDTQITHVTKSTAA